MSSIPASAIALFAIFLYNCVNAIFGYLTNVMEISMLQLLAFQAVRPYRMCRLVVGLPSDPPFAILRDICYCYQTSSWPPLPPWYSDVDLGNRNSCGIQQSNRLIQNSSRYRSM